MQPASRLSIVLALGVVYVVWGSTYLAIRFAVESLPPFSMAAVRFLVAGALLYGWARLGGAPKPHATHWRSAALVGLLLLLGGNGAVVWAQQSIDSSMAALLVTTTPLWMVLYAWALYGQRPSGGVLLGVLLGFGGTALLIGPGTLGEDELLPALVVVGGAASWALGSVLGQRIERVPQPLLGSGMEMLVGGVGLLLLGIASGEFARFDPTSVRAASIGGLAYLVVAGSLLGFSTYSWLLRHAPISVVSTYAYVNPVVAVWLGWFVAGEALSLRAGVASAIVVGSVALITTLQRTGRRAPSGQGANR
ncbi:MAG TPA: EamA family transporter [Fredinandcohnia sp.]|nr:EamA family transporter [Fredinandcohnia sp.]